MFGDLLLSYSPCCLDSLHTFACTLDKTALLTSLISEGHAFKVGSLLN
uniref:Uncharacterized protein n=1 Tax=Manihot esculenta TaxID=3983 RepID=A0A2C9WPH0_MANES